jgi:hypothetical protein
MNARGLLVEDHNGQDFLLTTESGVGMKAQQLAVLQRIDGQWQPVKGTEEVACRESLIGAFVDFFVDFCRVLNSSGPDRVPPITSVPGRSQTGQPAVIKRRRS